VLVECLIAEVNANNEADFGIQWQTAIGKNGDRNIGIVGTNSSLGGANIIDLAIAAATKNPAGAAALASGLNFGVGTKINGHYVLGFRAHFLQSNGEGNVLSTPNLLTLDNQEAKIVIGQNVPFVTGQYTNTGSLTPTVNPFQTIERKDVGLTLRIRPQINEDNMVKMILYQEVSAIDPSSANNTNGPTTNKRSLETSVVVNDGAIIVLGGLLQDEYSANLDKVPLLGDIPIAGNLFKSEVRTRKKTNLMIFLRPLVIRDQSTSDALAHDRYEEIRSAQKAVSPDYHLMLNNVRDANLLPALPPAQQQDETPSATPAASTQP
jgi:general secretion pathway protein D